MSTPLPRIQALAAAAGHLCCALQELAGADCAAWVTELGALIERLDTELADAARSDDAAPVDVNTAGVATRPPRSC